MHGHVCDLKFCNVSLHTVKQDMILTGSSSMGWGECRLRDTPRLSFREKLVAPRLAVSLACFHLSKPDTRSRACLCATSRTFAFCRFRISMSQSELVQITSNVIVSMACTGSSSAPRYQLRFNQAKWGREVHTCQ